MTDEELVVSLRNRGWNSDEIEELLHGPEWKLDLLRHWTQDHA